MADEQVFPITYKAGILRDGAFFQGDYCPDGQWVRFFRGQPQNIGGMKTIEIKSKDLSQKITMPNSAFPCSCLVYYDNDGQHILIGCSQGTTSFPGNKRANNIHLLYKEGLLVQVNYNKFADKNRLDRLIQYIPIISTINNIQTNLIIGLNMQNYLDITTSSPIESGIVIEGMNFRNLEFPDFVFREATGGMLYVSNRLFIYGNNGVVRWSSASQEKSDKKTSLKIPFLFFEDRYSINISTDKVIYGAEWRGGVNTPTIIFWTLSSVIRITNITGSSSQPITDPDDLSFRREVISRDSSILSSRSVVEYDGIFYWPGTQRFFVFNGVVLPLENNLNRQTFFDTIDMKKRQKVFGIKNVSRDEIWWFYPEKGKADDVGCTRAVIYNVIDNSWYDTAIERSAGYFDNVSGNMYSVGKNLVPYPNDSNHYIWQHEVENDQVNLYYNGEAGSDTAQVKPIISYFTTPIISYATYNKFKQPVGVDSTMKIMRIEPNLVPTDQVNMTITINSYEYPTSKAVPSEAILITEVKEDTRIVKPRIDVEYQGGNINFTFRSNGLGSGYQMGTNFVVAKIGDNRI